MLKTHKLMLFIVGVLVIVLLLSRDAMTKATYKRRQLMGLAYSFRSLVHYPHGGEHGSG